jgi:uncharacterized integral membrane protein
MDELSKTELTFVKLNLMGSTNELPLLVIYLLAALANAGILEKFLNVWKEKRNNPIEIRKNQ